jgi:hypothetical protein
MVIFLSYALQSPSRSTCFLLQNQDPIFLETGPWISKFGNQRKEIADQIIEAVLFHLEVVSSLSYSNTSVSPTLGFGSKQQVIIQSLCDAYKYSIWVEAL